MNRFERAVKFLFGRSGGSFIWDWTSAPSWSKQQLILEYKRYVYSIVSRIAQDTAKIDFEVYKGSSETPLVKHGFLDLIKKPNEQQSQFQFLELHQTYMELVGESFWYIARGEQTKQPRAFFLLRPDLMEVVVDDKSKEGYVNGYVLNKQDGKKIPFTTEEILHFKLPNPYNPYYGLGPLQAAMVYVQTEQYGSEFTRNSILNSGRPSGILNFKGKVNAQEFDQIKKRFKQEYTGTGNAGKTMMVNGADELQYQKLGMELGEVALQEMKDMSRNDIMFMWGMSKTMMGISDDVNLNNAKESRGVYTQNIIIPRMDRLIDHLNVFLMPSWGENTNLAYVNPIEDNIADHIEEWDKGYNRWLTRNDIRKERGLKPAPGGDEFIKIEPTGKPGDRGNGSNSNDDKKPAKGLKKKELTEPESFRLEFYKKVHAWEPIFQSKIRKIFAQQEKEILQRNTKIFEEWKFDEDKSQKLYLELLIPEAEKLMREMGLYTLDFMEDKETAFFINERLQSYITERIRRFAVGVDSETISQIEETILEGIRNGENISKMRSRIQAVYQQANKVRAEIIARTEVSALSNEAALEAYRNSPVVTGKEWYAQPDACPFCMSMNGKVVQVDTDYFKVGQSITLEDGSILRLNYENVGKPPLHPNCECALLPVRIN